MNLSEKIVTLRKSRGMSQEDLAEKLNVSRQTISRWENGTVVPDAYNILEISKTFGVTSDYLLNDDYNNDDDIPRIKEVKKDNRILHLNLTKLAIILQMAALNAVIAPLTGATVETEDDIFEAGIFIFKLGLLLFSSIWMLHNLKYEKNPKQYKQNVFIELSYCGVQAVIFLTSYLCRVFFNPLLMYIATPLLLANTLFYLLFINPKYMNRPFIKK